MKFAIFISLIVALMPTVHAADKKKAAEPTVTYQTMPNSNSRDYSKPAFVTQDGVTYQTMPGSTTRDYSAPTWVTKHEETYQTMPGSTTRDYSKPAFRTEKK
jgi:hypothetical protein